MLPDIDGSVLEVLVVPKGSVPGGIVRVPVLVLAAGEGVEVENGVDAVFRTLKMVDSPVSLNHSAEDSISISYENIPGL